MIAVTGLPRCGSTATMHMLQAAGIKMAGAPLDKLMESPRVAELTTTELDRDDSWAIKLINPHVLKPPHGPDYRWIIISRNPKHQIRSQHKCARWMGKARGPTSIKEGMRRVRATICRLGGKVLHLTYEDLCEFPMLTATRIAEHVRHPVDPVVMAAVIHDRSPACLSYMAEGEYPG